MELAAELTDVRAELLPENKLTAIIEFKQRFGSLAVTGDGRHRQWCEGVACVPSARSHDRARFCAARVALGTVVVVDRRRSSVPAG